jgi:alkylhydroperoxidase/carboxymuconolactone decarboxylase family protein YurZ
MEKFKHLDAKAAELAAISASIAGGCLPYLNYHFKKALEICCTLEQAIEAIELGKMIKQKPIADIFEKTEKLILNTIKNKKN